LGVVYWVSTRNPFFEWGVQRGKAPSPVLSPPKGQVCEGAPHMNKFSYLGKDCG